MINSEKKLKKDAQGSILCPKHKIIASNICLEENCEYQINCMNCSLFEQHTHSEKLFSIPIMLNKNIDDQIYDLNLTKKEMKNFIKIKFGKIKNEIYDEIDLIEKKIIGIYEEEGCFGHEIVEKRKNFRNSKEKFVLDNENFLKLKEMTENFRDYIKCSFKNKLYVGNFVKYLKFSFEKVRKELKNIIENFEIQKNNIFFDSNLILENEDKLFVKDTLFDNMPFRSNLLYKGSRDGFKASKFHSLCDNKGPTITIIKSHLKKIFGGFINNSWNSKNSNTYHAYCKKSSFLFSLDRKEKYKLKKNIGDIKINLGNPNYSAVFGCNNYSYDLQISDDCNINNNSISNFGNTYTNLEDIKFNTTIGKTYLAGEHKFIVKEIEVYSLEFL